MTEETPDCEAERDKLLKLLYWIRFEMHRVYGNTSYRGRGIGGQTMTAQCHVVDPTPEEYDKLQEVEKVIYEAADRGLL